MVVKASGEGCEVGVNPSVVAGLIAQEQKPNGEIPWHGQDKTDPWDHVEAAMGLAVGGYLAEARSAYGWMADHQLADGSWYAAYRDGAPEDRTRDTNMSTYIAVGVLHYYFITRDRIFLEEMWSTVSAAVEFALRMQADGGEVHWAISPEGETDPMALLTGSSSVYQSLKCALLIADRLGRSRPSWREGLRRLREAIRFTPHRFNLTKARYGMDWFYPILAGAVTQGAAERRIDRHWNKFVVKGRGVRCVSDRPWVTIAETSELCIALAGMGKRRLAELVYGWIQPCRYPDGSFWCGFTYPDGVIWPEDRLTWTNAAVLLACDALYDLTPGARVFQHRFWSSPEVLSVLTGLRETELSPPPDGSGRRDPLVQTENLHRPRLPIA